MSVNSVEKETRRGPQDTTKVHETEAHDFLLDGFGWVIAKERVGGGMLKSQSVEALLLLDIARTLADIRQWGLAQSQEMGQKVYPYG